MHFIAKTLATTGQLRREDIEREFRLSTCQASIDIRRYRQLHPGELAYDLGRKMYVPASSSAERATLDLAAALIRRYYDNHCANADAEGMSAVCDCKLCAQARIFLKFTGAFEN